MPGRPYAPLRARAACAAAALAMDIKGNCKKRIEPSDPGSSSLHLVAEMPMLCDVAGAGIGFGPQIASTWNAPLEAMVVQMPVFETGLSLFVIRRAPSS